MIRNLARNVISLSAALVLLALLFCAVEVALRSGRLRSKFFSQTDSHQLDQLTMPSGTSWIEVKPLLDVEHQTRDSRHIRIRTNELGLRARSVSIPKPRGTYRVICLGGDNVFGSDLVAQETLPAQLQTILKEHSDMPVEVINAGCPLAGPLINLLRYRAQLSALQPDLVIFCLNEQDLGRDRDVRGALHLDDLKNPAYAAHPGLRGQGCDTLDSLCNEFLILRWLVDWAGEKVVSDTHDTRSRISPIRENLRRDLAAIVPLSDFVSGQFGRLMISVSPSAWNVDRARNTPGSSPSAPQPSTLAAEIREFLTRTRYADRIEVQDGLTVFCQSPDARSLFSPETGALSAQGNQLYAQQLAGYILENIPELRAVQNTTSPTPLPPPIRTVPATRPFPLEQSNRRPETTIIR